MRCCDSRPPLARADSPCQGADSPYQGEMSRSDRGDREAVERSETDEGTHGDDGRFTPPPPHPSFASQMPPSPLWGEGFAGGHMGSPLRILTNGAG